MNKFRLKVPSRKYLRELHHSSEGFYPLLALYLQKNHLSSKISTFVFDPTVSKSVEIFKVKGSMKRCGVLVVKSSFSMKLVLKPVSNICRPVFSVEKWSFSLKGIIFEIAFVVNSIRINKFSISIFHAILLHSLKVCIIFIVLNNKHALLFILGFQFILTERIKRWWGT